MNDGADGASSVAVPMSDASVNADIPRRGTHLKWYERRAARTVFRSVFSTVNAIVFFCALLVLVEFVREIEKEQERVNAAAEPVAPSATVVVNNSTNLSWQERYILLGRDVFGDNYKAVVDVYFSFVIVATFAGAFGGILRQATPVWVAVVCYVPSWGFTFASIIGIHRHLSESEHAKNHDESQARYKVALAWSWMSWIAFMLLFVVGNLLGRSMREHKADRYRVVRRRRGGGDSEDDEDDYTDEVFMTSTVPHHTTDGSGPPRRKLEAKREAKRDPKDVSKDSPRKPVAGEPFSPGAESATSAESASASAAAADAQSNLSGSFARRAAQKAGAKPLTAEVVRSILQQATIDNLPEGFERQTCHHVYDGDTLTLDNRERVRLLGIDTPEISRFEAFAEDARNFTKRWCEKRTLFLHQPSVMLDATYDSRGNASKGNSKFMVDTYGRRRAVVYVSVKKDQLMGQQQQPQGASTTDAPGGASPAVAYLNVNEALLLLGFARFYVPQPERESPFQARFIALQREALQANRGVWCGFKDYDVAYAKSSDVFYKAGSAMAGKISSKELVKTTAVAALNAGYAPSRT